MTARPMTACRVRNPVPIRVKGRPVGPARPDPIRPHRSRRAGHSRALGRWRLPRRIGSPSPGSRSPCRARGGRRPTSRAFRAGRAYRARCRGRVRRSPIRPRVTTGPAARSRSRTVGASRPWTGRGRRRGVPFRGRSRAVPFRVVRLPGSPVRRRRISRPERRVRRRRIRSLGCRVRRRRIRSLGCRVRRLPCRPLSLLRRPSLRVGRPVCHIRRLPLRARRLPLRARRPLCRACHRPLRARFLLRRACRRPVGSIRRVGRVRWDRGTPRAIRGRPIRLQLPAIPGKAPLCRIREHVRVTRPPRFPVCGAGIRGGNPGTRRRSSPGSPGRARPPLS